METTINIRNRFGMIGQIMTTQVVSALPDTSILDITGLMARQNVSSVVIVEAREQSIGNSSLFPIGIVTAMDLVQSQALGLDCERIQASAVMSTPVFAIGPDDYLTAALLLMQEKQINQVVVTGEQGELLGIVTQTTLLQALNPIEMYQLVQRLEQRISQLETENLELLHSPNLKLEQEVQQRTTELQAQAEREHLLRAISSRIRASLDLQDTLNAIVTEVQQFLKCDRVYICQLNPDWSGTIVAESLTPHLDSILGRIVDNRCFGPDWVTPYSNREYIRVVADIYQVSISPSHRQFLEQLQIRAKVVVPILQGGMLWGLLSATEANTPRDWQSEEVNLLRQLSTHVEMAIQQAKAYECSQVELAERQRREREICLLQIITQSISQAEDFNAALEVTLHQICEFTDWSYGEVWLPSPDNTYLQLSSAWYFSDPASHSFRLDSTATTCAPNQGLPGRVWASQQSEWISNVSEQTVEEFFRVESAQKNGLKAAFGVPILAKEGVVAIFIFLATQAIEHDESLIQLITSVTLQLGQIIWRKQIEDALRQSEHRYASLAAAAPVGIFRTDAEGNSLYVNERLCEITGLTSAETIGRGWRKVLHPNDWERFLVEKNRSVQENNTFRLEYRLLRPDGKVIWVFGQAVAEQGQDGQITGYIGTVTDISERKQAQIDLQKLAEAAVAVTGQDFFPALAEYMATALGVSYVQIATREGNDLNTHAFWANGQLQPNISFAIENTPCGRAMLEGIYCCAEGVQQEFPDNQLLAALGVESYLGIALNNIHGDVFGNLCILDDQQLANIPRITAMLKIFAARVSAELERQEAIAALHQLNQELEARIDQRTAALRESEERWQLALQGSNDGIWDWNLKTNQVFYSTRWKQMRDFAEHEISDDPEEWSTRIHADDYSFVITAMADHLAGKTPFFQEEYRVQRKDGSYMWVLDRGQALWNEAGNPIRIAGSETDITRRKQAEAQLLKSEIHLSAAQRIAHLGSWEFDLQTYEITWSKEIFHIFGCNPEDGTPTYEELQELVHPDDRDSLADAMQQAIKYGQSYEIEYRLYRPDGMLRYLQARGEPIFNSEGKPVRLVGTILDISDRKQSEETLKQQLAAIEAAIDGIALLKGIGCDLFFTYLNKAHIELFGYTSPEELVGHNWQKLYSAAEISRFQQDIFPILKQQQYWQGTATAIRKDGSTFTEGLSLTLTEGGEVICVCRDITEQRQSEEKLRLVNERLTLANAELHRATRLKDEFLANMSHELRTPLNAVLGMSEGLQEEVFGQLNSLQKQAIGTIERSGKHLLELINDILDLSKIESGKLELQTAPIAVSYLCDTSLTFVRQQAIKKNLHLTAEVPPNLPDLVVDKRRIRQVLINLLNNAVKFTNSGGSVKLVVKREQHQQTDFLCFSVIDTGIGIAQENLGKLFQPFVQIDSSLNRQYNGTGLGLSLVRRLVELHGGKVTVTSEVGRGSCFTVCLPYVITLSLSAKNNTQATAINAISPDNSQVLIIEDSIIAAEQVARYLGELGMQTAIYSQGEGAIQEALRIHPTLIILDIQLPSLSGWEVLKQLKAHPQTQNIPVLVISVVDERSPALSLGAFEYLVKPINREQFRQIIERLRHPEDSPINALIIAPQVAPIEVTCPPLILLAEDNEANVTTISCYLEARGYRLILAKNGEDAVTLTKIQNPHLILMDIQMPKLDGLKAIRQIRAEQHFIHTPIIALTALAMPKDGEDCMEAGANHYFTKPVKLKLLVETIQNLLNKK